MRVWVVLTLIAASISHQLLLSSGQEQCGWQTGGAVCPGGLCCSEWGYCGTTDPYCGIGCQSNCPSPSPPPPPPPPVTPTPPTPGGDITSIINAELFDRMLLHRSTFPCVGAFYTYDSFVTAARAFPAFGNTGDLETREREVAAFFGQTSQETTGGWPTAPDGNYSWGYCWIKEDTPATCCVADANYPCVPGKTYCGRGPIQLTYNYNYGQAGEALGLNLLSNPELVETDPVVSFKTAIWFWMTPQPPKPSCHEVIIGEWTPTSQDVAAGRLPGYGVITNIINGGVECGKGPVNTVVGRIGFYERYCDFFGIDYGDNLDCFQQRPFGSGFVFASK